MKKQAYKGRINPHESISVNDTWLDLLIERYKLFAGFCINRLVLDTCCGTGWGTAKFIAPIANQVFGFDLEPPCTTEEYEKSKCHFFAMDATKIAFNGFDFDIILALDSIEHMALSDGISYLEGIKSALKKYGILFGTTPLVENDYLIPIFLGWNKFHVHMYTEDDLRSALNTQFENINIYRIYNEVCPYFAFTCSDSKDELNAIDLRIKEFIYQNKKRFALGKRNANRLWAKHLIKRGKILKAANCFLESLDRFE